MYRRHLQPVIRDLLGEFRIVYVAGPRQAGKTTLAHAVAGELDMGFITLDDQPTLASARSDPHGFIRALDHRPVVLDEFQYAPELVSAIKEASDRLGPREKGRFLLTGSADVFSSARTQEALPGHMARLELLPLSLTELLGSRTNFIDCLLRERYDGNGAGSFSRNRVADLVLGGGYPEVQGMSERAKATWYKSYMEGRLYKDFESLYDARGDYRSRIRALAPYLAGLSGNLLKYANVANDLGLDDRLSKSYIETLELMFIVHRAPSYLRNRARRTATRMPKLHYVDTGLACHLLGFRNREQLMRSHHFGGLFESLIYMECLKHAAWAAESVSVYHFRNNRKQEVDIVLERGAAGIIGVEVKASASVAQSDFKGLAALADYAGDHFERGVLIYTGREVLPFRHGDHTFHALPLGRLLENG